MEPQTTTVAAAEESGGWGKIILIIAGAAAIGLGVWRFYPREPPDITEAQAKELAEGKLVDFCSGEKAICLDFVLKGTEAPTDNRFHWAYRWENVKVVPAQRVFISVGKKGDHSVEFTTFEVPPPDPMAAPAEDDLGPPAPPAEGASPAEMPPGEAPPGQ